MADPPQRQQSSRRPQSGEEEISALLGVVYDAALDPGLWSEAVRHACGYLNCMAGALGIVDLFGRSSYAGWQWGYTEHWWQIYLDRYFHANLLNGPSFRTRVGQVLLSSGIDNFAEFLTSEFYRDWVAPQGIVDGIQGTVDKTASSITVLTLTRHESVGASGPEEARRMELILPHFRRAFLIGRVIDVHRRTAAAFAETIDAMASAVFLIGTDGKLVYANPAGQAMLDRGDPLHATRDVLIASDPKLDLSLRRSFRAASSGDGADQEDVALPFSGRDGERFVAHVLPLTCGVRRQAAAAYSATAALFVRKADIDLGAAVDAARQLYGLTPAEIRVLHAVVEVGGIAPVAGMLGLSQATVKTHVQNLFAKTGARRQAELVRLVTGFDSPARRTADLSSSSQG